MIKKCYNSFIGQLNDLKKYRLGVKSYCIKLLSSIGNLLWFLAKKWVQIIIAPLFQPKFDDITVTLSLIVFTNCHESFFTNSP